MPVPRTAWQPGMRITSERMAATDHQRGTELVSFAALTSTSIVIAFPEAFTAAPIVMTNIASGSGNATRWGSRAINISANGFTLFLFTMDAASAAATWPSIPVQWHAIAA